jgi:hypothetical protein
MAPWVIMLLLTLRVSCAWQTPQVCGRDAQIAGVDEADEVGALLDPVGVGADGMATASGVGGMRGWTCALRSAAAYSAEPLLPMILTDASPPWQSEQPRTTVSSACMLGCSMPVWQEMQPDEAACACSGDSPRWGKSLKPRGASLFGGGCIGPTAVVLCPPRPAWTVPTQTNNRPQAASASAPSAMRRWF